MKTYKIQQYTCRLVRDGRAINVTTDTVRSFDEAVLFFNDLKLLAHEEMHTLFLNGANKVIGRAMVARGGMHGCSVQPREVFRPAIIAGAAAIIIAHNHPSGDPTPSPEDILTTRDFVQVGERIGMPVLDHVIMSRGAGSRTVFDFINPKP